MARNQQQQQTKKSDKKNSVPTPEDNLKWVANLVLPENDDGVKGTISVTSDTNIGLLAALRGLHFVRKAVVCPGCGNTDLQLQERHNEKDGQSWTQYTVQCFKCGGALSSNNAFGYTDMVIANTSGDGQWAEWWFPTKDGNDNQQSSNTSSRGSSSRGNSSRGSSQSSRGNGQGSSSRSQNTTRSSSRGTPPPQQDEYDGYDDSEDVPF